MLYTISLFIKAWKVSLTFIILFQKLYDAAENGDAELVKDCLQQGADVDYKDALFVSSMV